MRPARLSLLSFVLTTIPLVACTLDSSPSSCTDSYDCTYDDYPPYGSSSGDYGDGYDSGASSSFSSADGSSSSPSCEDSFAVAFDAPADYGNCKLEVSAYGSAYTGSAAIYYFAAPSADERVQCEALEGPLPGRCVRVLGTIALGSTSAVDVVALRAAIGLTGKTFTVKLSCAHSAYEPTKDVAITCGAKTPAGPHVGDDAGAPDASSDDASTPDAGCGP